MLRLSDKARGYIKVRVLGSEPARFLEELAKNSLEFWDAVPQDEFTLIISMWQRDALRLEALAQKSACEAQILSEHGGRVYAGRFKGRLVLWVLPLLLAAVLLLASFFVWEIEIEGNETVSDIEIRNVLEVCGVKIGSFWPGFSSESIRTKALLMIPELKWLSVSVFGSRAYVEVRERTEIPELFDEDEYVRLVASVNGIVERMYVLRGVRAIEDGRAAIAGDTLIDGVSVSRSWGPPRNVHAAGSVIARTWYEISACMPLEYTKKVYTGETRNRYSLKIGDERINFYRSSGILDLMCDNIIRESSLGIEGLFTLPLTLIRETSEPYELVQASYADFLARELLETLLNEELLRRIGKDGEVLSLQITFTVADGVAMAALRAECRQDIAVEELMFPQESDG
jgi:similar to stage IV sporulation protein